MFSGKFMISGFTFKPLMPFELIFMSGVRKGSTFILSHENIVFLTPFEEETIIFPLPILGSLVLY